MQRLDTFLLDRVYQPICDALYDHVGDCLVIARLMITLAILLSGLQLGWRLGDAMLHRPPIIAVLGFFLAQMFLISAMIYCSMQFRKFLGRKGANPLRIILYRLRITMVCWFTVVWVVWFAIDSSDLIGNLLGLLRDISIVSVMYFASCHNRPPMKKAKAYQFAPA